MGGAPLDRRRGEDQLNQAMTRLHGPMIALLLAAPALAVQGPPPGGGDGPPPPPPVEGGRRGAPPGPPAEQAAPDAAGIAWFGTWDAALAEAKRTRRPILFMSAAPQCHGVPGVW